MAWYLAPALAVGRAEVDQRWPKRDRTSEGTIGDRAHQQTQSDHNANERESVDAWDMDRDGVDVWVVIAAFQRHPSSHYWIYNRQIADKDDGWRRRAYSGPNPHTEHVHFSIRQTRTAEQDRRPWGLWPLPEENDMAEVKQADWDALIWRVHALANGATTVAGGPTKGSPVVLNVNLATLGKKVDALASGIASIDVDVATALRAELDEIDAQQQATLAAIEQSAAADAVRDAELRALVEQAQSGELDAAEVVRLIGEKLTAADASAEVAAGGQA